MKVSCSAGCGSGIAAEQVVGVVLGDDALVAEDEGLGAGRPARELPVHPVDVAAVEGFVRRVARRAELIEEDQAGVAVVDRIVEPGEAVGGRGAGARWSPP